MESGHFLEGEVMMNFKKSMLVTCFFGGYVGENNQGSR